jgi:hypothetical protein
VNTNTLAKQYGHLTPWERIPLMLAAEARVDELERRRLSDSAPIEAVKMPDYLMPLMALNTMSLMYITEQLDHLASYWHAVCQFLITEDKKRLHWKTSADAFAYVFSLNAEAWKRFCGGLNIDAAFLTTSNSLGCMLAFAESCMPNVAPSRDELRTTLGEYGVEDPNPVTADDLLASWQRLFDACTEAGNLAAASGGSKRSLNSGTATPGPPRA